MVIQPSTNNPIVVPEIIETLIEKFPNINFYLTGSRYFGDNDDNSDWDIITLDNYKLIRFLIDNNFTSTNSNYNDKSITKVYSNNKLGNEKIDIQLIINQDELKYKLQAHDIMLNHFYMYYIAKKIPEELSKDYKCNLWNMVISILRKIDNSDTKEMNEKHGGLVLRLDKSGNPFHSLTKLK